MSELEEYDEDGEFPSYDPDEFKTTYREIGKSVTYGQGGHLFDGAFDYAGPDVKYERSKQQRQEKLKKQRSLAKALKNKKKAPQKPTGQMATSIASKLNMPSPAMKAAKENRDALDAEEIAE